MGKLLSTTHSFPLWKRLCENHAPAMGNSEAGGMELQQRYDQSKRPEPVRIPSRRRQRGWVLPDRAIVPLPSQGTDKSALAAWRGAE